MHPEIKIVSYIIFAVSLFLITDLKVYFLILAVILLFFLRIPFSFLKKGWLPVSLFLSFTFMSNVLFQHGKILYEAGPFIISEEGIHTAILKTMRVFFMIAGAKILSATTGFERLLEALGKILKPFERLGIPVNEIFSTMGLTVKTFPKLKEQIIRTYREKVKDENVKGFWQRSKMVSAFLIPLFTKTIQSPELFFEEDHHNEKSR